VVVIMPLLESGENYLEAILILSNKQSEIHAIDIVNFLNFSKPSVSIMLKKLKDSGYISIDKNSHIQLTIQGKNVAEKIYERHTYLTDFLIKIGVDSSTAEEDACKIEHDLSDKSFQAIKQLIDKL
jgi:Mn-dependent DtxR family transcriptional regulator